MEVGAFVSLGALLVGLLARVFLPWLVVRRDNPDKAKWAWKYVWPQLLSFALVLIALPLVISDLESIVILKPQAAWLLGWGAADLGRKVYRTFTNEE